MLISLKFFESLEAIAQFDSDENQDTKGKLKKQITFGFFDTLIFSLE